MSGLRYVGIDLHRHYAMVAAVDCEGEVILAPRRVSTDCFEEWAARHLLSTDKVAIEACANIWAVYDLLEPLVDEVVVVHPTHFRIIASSSVKTDKRDTLALARVLAANLLSSIWIPPHHVRELRALIHHRRKLVEQRIDARNRLRSVLHIHNVTPPSGELFTGDTREWWESLELPESVKLRVRHNLLLLDTLTTLIKEVEVELGHLSVSDRWVDQVPFLIQLPGVATLTAMTILSAVGDITRFATPKKLVGYAGLGARVYSSGQTHRSGGISKQGRTELRTAVVEAAWVAVRTHPHWKVEYQRLASRKGKQKAIVVIARKLLVGVWHVLTYKTTDRYAEPPMVARSFYYWAARQRLATSIGQSRKAFVKHFLKHVGLPPELVACTP